MADSEETWQTASRDGLSPSPRRRSEHHLSNTIVDEMLKPQIKVAPNISWGLGWGFEHASGGNAFWHWGDWGVFRNFAVAIPAERTGIVVLTNSFYGPDVYRRIVSEATGRRHPAFAWLDSYRP